MVMSKVCSLQGGGDAKQGRGQKSYQNITGQIFKAPGGQTGLSLQVWDAEGEGEEDRGEGC